jgi:hypothetical protein
MKEQLALIEWSNKTPEKIKNIEKAEYMARVEDKWRDSISSLIFTATHDSENRENALRAAKLQALVFGPAAVEAAGKVWEDFNNPALPPPLNESLQNGSYATGSRQFLP